MTASKKTPDAPVQAQEFDEAGARARIAASPEFAGSAARWAQGVAALALEPAVPTPAVWERIDAGVQDRVASPTTLTVRADDGCWETIHSGVTRRVMHTDLVRGWQAILIRMEPGSSHPGHTHAAVEECLVLEGGFEFGDLVVRKGDLHLAFPGEDHPEIRSPGGALLYIRTALAA